MAYSTDWAGLFSDIITKTEDQSDELMTAIPGIIAEAESKTLRDLDLEIFQSEQAPVALVAHQRSQNRPAILKISAAWIVVGTVRNPIWPRKKEFLDMWAPDSSVEAKPTYYAEADTSTLYFVATPDQAYSLVTYGIVAPTGLSEQNTTTWLSTYVADLLLDNCLVGAERFLGNQNQASIWSGQYLNEKLPQAKVRLRGMQRSDYEAARMVGTAQTPL